MHADIIMKMRTKLLGKYVRIVERNFRGAKKQNNIWKYRTHFLTFERHHFEVVSELETTRTEKR